MKTGYSTACYGYEHERPYRKTLRVNVFQRKFRYRKVRSEEYPEGDAYRHDDEYDAEERIQPADDLIYREERRENVVYEDHDYPESVGQGRRCQP